MFEYSFVIFFVIFYTFYVKIIIMDICWIYYTYIKKLQVETLFV